MPRTGRSEYGVNFRLTAVTEGLKQGFDEAARLQNRFLGTSEQAWTRFRNLALGASAAASAAVAGIGIAGANAAIEIEELARVTGIAERAAAGWRHATRTWKCYYNH